MNLLLAGVLVFLLKRNSPPPPSSGGAARIQSNNLALAAEVVAETNATITAEVPFRWQMLESEDYRQYVANLRAVGCPETVVGDLIVDELEDHYRPKLRYEYVNFDPWVGRDRRDADQKIERSRQADVRREQSTVIKELLGYEWSSDLSKLWTREPTFWVALGFMTEDKARQVVSVLTSRFMEFEDQFSPFNSRIVIDEDIERFKSFRASLSAEAGRILSASELDELETRAQLGLVFSEQIHLDGMNATGAELRSIMHASKSYVDFLTLMLTQRGRMDRSSEKGPAYGEFETEVLASLGPARFAAFQRAQDEDFRDAFQFTESRRLPGSTAMTIYETQRNAEAQRREISFDSSLTEDERNAALQVLQLATSATVAKSLGGNYTNYLTSAGKWMGQLSSPATVEPIPQRNRQ